MKAPDSISRTIHSYIQMQMPMQIQIQNRHRQIYIMKWNSLPKPVVSSRIMCPPISLQTSHAVTSSNPGQLGANCLPSLECRLSPPCHQHPERLPSQAHCAVVCWQCIAQPHKHYPTSNSNFAQNLSLMPKAFPAKINKNERKEGREREKKREAQKETQLLY